MGAESSRAARKVGEEKSGLRPKEVTVVLAVSDCQSADAKTEVPVMTWICLKDARGAQARAAEKFH